MKGVVISGNGACAVKSFPIRCPPRASEAYRTFDDGKSGKVVFEWA